MSVAQQNSSQSLRRFVGLGLHPKKRLTEHIDSLRRHRKIMSSRDAADESAINPQRRSLTRLAVNYRLLLVNAVISKKSHTPLEKVWEKGRNHH